MAETWYDFAIWWVRFALAGGLLILFGVVLMRLIRQPAIRHRAGVWTIAGALFVAPMTLAPGWLPLPWDAPRAAASPPAMSFELNIDGLPDAGAADAAPIPKLPAVLPFGESIPAGPAQVIVPAIRTSESALAPARSETNWASFARVLLLIYLAGVAVLLARLVFAQLGLRRLWAGSRPAPMRAKSILGSLAPAGRRPLLRVSNRVSGPLCFGVLRAKILLPEVLARSADDTTLRWVLAHELNHAQRKDALTAWMVGVAQALYWFLPWFGMLKRDLRLCQEYLADAAAVGKRSQPGQNEVERPEEYASFLIQLIAPRAVPCGAAGVQPGSSDLFRRINMLLRTDACRTHCPRRWSLAAGVGLIATALLLGGLYLRPAAADDAPKADKKEPAKEKVAPEDRRKQLEEKLKKLDLNSPEYAEAMKEFERLMEEEKARQPKPAPPRSDLPRRFPNLPVAPIGPDELNKMIEEEQRKLLEIFKDFERRGLEFGPALGARGLRGNDARLGVRIEKPSAVLAEQLDLPSGKGLVVVEVLANSIAEKVGIKPNDVLLEVGGKQVPDEGRQFAQMIRDLKADEAVDIVVLRKGKKETLKDVKLPQVQAEPNFRFGPDGLPGADFFKPFALPGPGFNLPRRLQALPIPNGAASARMSVRVTDGEFTIESAENGLEYTIQGTRGDDGNKVAAIRIKEGDKESKYEKVESVPEQHRDKVKKLLESVK